MQLRLRMFGIHIPCNPHNYSCHFLFFKKILIEVLLNYNAVLVSGIQQSDSVTHIY